MTRLELDSKDKKILYELDHNSRQPVSRIAKRLRMGKTAVAYRINSLQKKGVIERFHTLVNFGKLGYIGASICIRLQGVTPTKKGEIIGFFGRNKDVCWLASAEGEYDLCAFIWVKSASDLILFWKELLGGYGGYIEERTLTISGMSLYFPKAYLSGIHGNKDEILYISEPESSSVDDKDKAILKLLVPNARLPVIEIAEKVGVTPKTVMARIKLLEKSGVIAGYVISSNAEKVGYLYFKIGLRLSDGGNEKGKSTNLRLLKEYAKQHPNVTGLDEDVGGPDIEIQVQTESLAELRSLINGLNSKFSGLIKNYQVINIYKQHKYLMLPSGI